MMVEKEYQRYVQRHTAINSLDVHDEVAIEYKGTKYLFVLHSNQLKAS